MLLQTRVQQKGGRYGPVRAAQAEDSQPTTHKTLVWSNYERQP